MISLYKAGFFYNIISLARSKHYIEGHLIKSGCHHTSFFFALQAKITVVNMVNKPFTFSAVRYIDCWHRISDSGDIIWLAVCCSQVKFPQISKTWEIITRIPSCCSCNCTYWIPSSKLLIVQPFGSVDADKIAYKVARVS